MTTEHQTFILDTWEQVIAEEIDYDQFCEYVRDYLEDNYIGA